MATAQIRAFSDAFVEFASGDIMLSFSLDEGDYDMTRAIMPGMPLLHSHNDELRIGTIVGFSVARPDPDGEGNAAMYLAAEILPDEQLSEECQGIKAQMLAGSMKGTSGQWLFTSWTYLEPMPPPADKPTPAYGAWKVRRWEYLEHSTTNIPRVRSARVLTVSASESDAESDAALLAYVQKRREELSMTTQNAAAPAPTAAPVAPPVAAPVIDYDGLAAWVGEGRMTAAESLQVPGVDFRMMHAAMQRYDQAKAAPAASPAFPPTPPPEPEPPVQIAAPPSPPPVTLEGVPAFEEMRKEMAGIKAALDTERKLNEEQRIRLSSIVVQPHTIEQRSREDRQGFNLEAAFSFRGARGSRTQRLSEKDFPHTRVRLAEMDDAKADQRIHFPATLPYGTGFIYCTREDLWGPDPSWQGYAYMPKISGGGLPPAEGYQAIDSGDVVQRVRPIRLVDDPNIENFPYKAMLRVVPATGEMWVPYVSTEMTVNNPDEGAASTASDLVEDKYVLRPRRAQITVEPTTESVFLNPGLEADVRRHAGRLMRADDQKFVEMTYHATNATQGMVAVPGSDKVAIGAAGATLTLPKVLDTEKHLRDAAKGMGVAPYFYILESSAYFAGRAVVPDMGSGRYLIRGDVNSGVFTETGAPVYASSLIATNGGVLVPGRHYTFAEWQGVMVTVDYATKGNEGKAVYHFTTFRNGVAVYPATFPYFAES